MTDYCRFYIPGSTWFFTVNLRQRRGNHLLVDRIDLLREAFRYVKQRDKMRFVPQRILLWSSRISPCRNDGVFAIMRMAETSAKPALRWTFNAKLYA